MRVRGDTQLAAVAAAAAACRSATHAFRIISPSPSSLSAPSTTTPSYSSSSSSSSLFAKGRKTGGNGSDGVGGGRGFGRPDEKKKKKYSIDDKSYGTKAPPPSSIPGREDDAVATSRPSEEEWEEGAAEEFFAAHEEWGPLFREVMSSSSPASRFLSSSSPDEGEGGIWGLPTLERRNPWRLLPAKPTFPPSLDALSSFLDEWQRSLLDIPLDSIVTGENDAHFLEEGRRTIAVTRFHVLDEYLDDDHGVATRSDGEGVSGDWETELFRTCWSELAHLSSKDECGTGSLVLLPDRRDAGDDRPDLARARSFVEERLIRPMSWLGRAEDWEIVAMERGSVGVRMLYRLGDIPDLKERDKGGEDGDD